MTTPAERVDATLVETRRLMDRLEAWRAVGYEQPSKQGGAVRRASLDLTRALADLRRS